MVNYQLYQLYFVHSDFSLTSLLTKDFFTRLQKFFYNCVYVHSVLLHPSINYAIFGKISKFCFNDPISDFNPFRLHL